MEPPQERKMSANSGIKSQKVDMPQLDAERWALDTVSELEDNTFENAEEASEKFERSERISELVRDFALSRLHPSNFLFTYLYGEIENADERPAEMQHALFDTITQQCGDNALILETVQARLRDIFKLRHFLNEACTPDRLITPTGKVPEFPSPWNEIKYDIPKTEMNAVMSKEEGNGGVNIESCIINALADYDTLRSAREDGKDAPEIILLQCTRNILSFYSVILQDVGYRWLAAEIESEAMRWVHNRNAGISGFTSEQLHEAENAIDNIREVSSKSVETILRTLQFSLSGREELEDTSNHGARAGIMRYSHPSGSKGKVEWRLKKATSAAPKTSIMEIDGERVVELPTDLVALRVIPDEDSVLHLQQLFFAAAHELSQQSENIAPSVGNRDTHLHVAGDEGLINATVKILSADADTHVDSRKRDNGYQVMKFTAEITTRKGDVIPMECMFQTETMREIANSGTASHSGKQARHGVLNEGTYRPVSEADLAATQELRERRWTVGDIGSTDQSLDEGKMLFTNPAEFFRQLKQTKSNLSAAALGGAGLHTPS